MNRGVLWMVAAALLFALMGVCVKYATINATPAQAVFFRAFVGIPFLWWIAARHHIPLFSSSHKSLLLFRGVFGFISLALYFYAISKIPLGNASILNATAPIFVVLFSSKYLGEKVHSSIYYALPLFFVGVYLLVKPTHSFDGIHSLAGFISGITASLAYVSVRKLGKTEHTTTVVFYFSFISLIGSLPLLLFHWNPLAMKDTIFLVGSGLFATAAQLAMTKAYKLERASLVSLYGYLSPLFAYGLAMIFFQEIPDRWSALGATLILLTALWIYNKNAIPEKTL